MDTDGVYMLAKGCTGEITVNAQNVKFIQEDPSTPLNNVTILGREESEANLWIDNLNINTQVRDPIIKFRGSGNVLTLKGTSYLTKSEEYSAINVGNGLTLEACKDDPTATLNVVSNGNNAIGIDYSSEGVVRGRYPQDGKLVNTYITINSGTYVINARAGAGIGAADNTYIIGDINITGGDITVTSQWGSAIGCGSGQMGYGGDGLKSNINIGKATINVNGINLTKRDKNFMIVLKGLL